MIQQKYNLCCVLVLLAAASAQSRCTALVCSCYVPSRSSNYKCEESNRSSNNCQVSTNKRAELKKGDGVIEEVDNHSQTHGTSSTTDKSKDNSSNSKSCGYNDGPHRTEPPNLKSILKKSATVEENHQQRTERRKVCWPDAHGKAIADVKEFEPSVSEDGDLEGVRNSCVCVIQ